MAPAGGGSLSPTLCTLSSALCSVARGSQGPKNLGDCESHEGKRGREPGSHCPSGRSEPGPPGWAPRPRQSPGDRPRDRLPGAGHSFRAGARCQGRRPEGAERAGPHGTCIVTASLAHPPGSRDPTGGGGGDGRVAWVLEDKARAAQTAPAPRTGTLLSEPPAPGGATRSSRTLVRAPPCSVAAIPARMRWPWGGSHCCPAGRLCLVPEPRPLRPALPESRGAAPSWRLWRPARPVTATSSPLQPACSFREQGPPKGLAVRQQRVTALRKLLCQAL